MTAMLETHAVCTFRGRVQVLWDISMQIARGETVAIVGPNGAGKTSLIGSLVGLLPPASGTVHIAGADVTGAPSSALAKRRVAVVPERRQVFGPLTVRENMLVGAYARKAPPRVLASDVDDMVGLFPGLQKYLDTAAGSLSGGEQQMVSIARALMAKPELLLLDEPSLGLAPKIRSEIFGALSRLAERGVTVVLVEQNVRMAARICSRAYMMASGRIVGTCSASELAASARSFHFSRTGESPPR